MPGSLHIKVLDEPTLANSLLPYVIHDAAGEFTCPEYWKLPPSYLSQDGYSQAGWRSELRLKRDVR